MAHVRQNLPSDRIRSVAADVRGKLLEFGLREKIKPGNRIAITAGSRGIGGLIDLLSGIADAVKTCGGEPFIIPAMGSHGGATPEGQAEILNRLGVYCQSAGAPIRATMETRELGRRETEPSLTWTGSRRKPTASLSLGRTKTHPESAAELASGLLKMCTIGLGKQTGAHQAHSHGLWDSVRAVPKVQLANRKFCAASRWSRTDTGNLRDRSRPAIVRRFSRSRYAPAAHCEISISLASHLRSLIFWLSMNSGRPFPGPGWTRTSSGTGGIRMHRTSRTTNASSSCL